MSHFNHQIFYPVSFLDRYEKLFKKEVGILRNKENLHADRRTRYTCQTIRDSLLSIMKQKAFSKITVTEVCRLSELNRGTFYLHYYDLEDVLDDMIENAIQGTTPLLNHVMCPE